LAALHAADPAADELSMSIAYYDGNAAAFFAGSVGADMSIDRARFLAHVPRGGAVLDAGCGSGRDALAFKTLGYAVAAFDGSAEMARRAGEHAGLPVRHLAFADVAWREAFDGIWACASLLHVPHADLPGDLTRLAQTLRPGGVFYMSFKYGRSDRFVHGRYFNDMTEERLTAALAPSALRIAEMWTSHDVRPERAGERWLSVLAIR
jgi:SAM-dependent methyltransferase